MQNSAMQIGLITLPKTEMLSRFKLLFHSWVLLIPPSLFCQSTHLLSLYLCLVNALILTQISSCSLLHFLNKLRNSVLPHGHFSLAFLDFNPAWTWGLMIWDSSLRRSFGKAVALSCPHQVPRMVERNIYAVTAHFYTPPSSGAGRDSARNRLYGLVLKYWFPKTQLFWLTSQMAFFFHVKISILWPTWCLGNRMTWRNDLTKWRQRRSPIHEHDRKVRFIGVSVNHFRRHYALNRESCVRHFAEIL